MAKAAIGATVIYCGHRGTFIADIYEVGNVNVVHASREVTPENLERDGMEGPAGATHHLLDFPTAGFWKPRHGVFVVPKEQVKELNAEPQPETEKGGVPDCSEPAGLHRLKRLVPPEPSDTPSRPFRYRCVTCQKRFKILSGVLLRDEA